MTDKDIDQLAINTIRTLCMDAVQQANSGHHGTPMALAPVAYCLWQRLLQFDPEHPIWPPMTARVPRALMIPAKPDLSEPDTKQKPI